MLNGSGRTSIEPLFPGALSLSGILLAGFILIFPGRGADQSGALSAGPSAAALFTFGCCLLFFLAAPRLSFFMNYEDWLSAGMPDKPEYADGAMLAFAALAALAGLFIARRRPAGKQESRENRKGGGAR